MQPFHVHRQICISGGGAILCHEKNATAQAKLRVFWSVKPYIKKKNVVAECAAVPSKESKCTEDLIYATVIIPVKLTKFSSCILQLWDVSVKVWT